MKKTNDKKVKKDYDLVINVLKSSKNYNHINATDRLMNNFCNKWKFDLKKSLVQEFTDNYLKEKKLILSNL